MANSRLINRSRVSTSSNRTIISPKATRINFNMIGGHPTLHIYSKNGLTVGTLLCRGCRIDIEATDTSNLRSIEVSIIEQAYQKLRELTVKTRRNSDDKNDTSNRASSSIVDNTKLNVKGADNLRSVDINWVNDLRIVEIINNDKIVLL